MEIIKNVKLLNGGTVSKTPFNIYMENGKITKLEECAPSSEPVLFATAGFIDEHTHGGNGLDYFECSQASADAMGSFHLKYGTTSFCAASVATPLSSLDVQIEEIRSLKNNYADMIGLHLEGPFISLAKKGAQPEANIKTVFEESDKAFFDKNSDLIRIVTMCPRTENAPALVKCLKSNGIIAHAGHDDSIYPEIMSCVAAGLSGATHIYCASSGLGRRPGDLTKYIGLNETAMLEPAIMTEVIADDIHISEPLFKFIYKNKGFRNIILVSDSLSAAGMPVGPYKLGREVDVYNNGKVALLASLKALAGSITPVSRMVEIVTSYGIPLAEAAYMGNEAPATHLGLTDRGSIAVGKLADICLLNSSGELQSVYFRGSQVTI